MCDVGLDELSAISATMQCRHKQNIVVVDELIFIFSFKFPIGVVDQD
jgi:hypothetical protein